MHNFPTSAKHPHIHTSISMLILHVKEIGGAVIATTVVGRIQHLEGDSERIAQVLFPHVVGNDSRETIA